MRRRYVSVLCVIGILLILQYGREPNVCNTRIEASDDGYYENIAVISNKLHIFDKEEFAKQLIQKIVDNSLKDVIFSYDIQGYPSGVYISVYNNEYSYKNGKRSFKILYLQDVQQDLQYNIKDNPDKFVLEIVP